MLEILYKINYLTSVPAQLAELMARRQFLRAVRLLSHTISLLCGDDLSEVNALQELREDMLTRKAAVQVLAAFFLLLLLVP
jgi:hypothetical protein